MNKFFRTFWAALLAFVVGTVVVWLMLILIFAGISAAFTPKPVAIMNNSVLKIDLASSIVDSPGSKSVSFNFSTYDATGSLSLLEVLNSVERAETDPNIKGIYINLTGSGGMGISQVEELRDALIKFKESGKFIVSYEEFYSQVGYYLASVSDKVFLNPQGGMTWNGLSATVMFYKGLLDKLDVQVEILRHGTYKSAVEPFMDTKMSAANREQTSVYVNSMWNIILSDISRSRGIATADLNRYADELAVRDPQDAKRLGFVDELLYEDQVMNVLAALVNGEEIEDYNDVDEAKAPVMTSMGAYVSSTAVSTRNMSRNKIAVIYADGDITDGNSSPGIVGSATVAKKLAEARKDENVKAVVFRVNSPGGSAMASEVMWREVEMLREEKPVIISMGSYAASGGYYISCAGDVILSDRSTITGSIGVFGMMMNLEKTMKNKLGLTTDVVRTNPHGDMGQPFRGLTQPERDYFMHSIKGTYNTFVTRVADGRNMTFEEVDKIGEGRVWLGTDAREIGLVDGFGGIKDAIALAADRAGIAHDFRVYEMADSGNPFSALFRALADIPMSSMRNELGDAFTEYNHLMKTLSEPGVQARMPYVIDIR